jgi:hypothetical protein
MNMSSSNFSIKADTLFFIIIGQKDVLEQLIKAINKSLPSEKFILTKINCPSASRSIELMKEINYIDNFDMLNSYMQKVVIVDDGIEFAQGHVYADGLYNDTHYILQILTDNTDYYTLSFLKFALDEDDNPETIIEEWFKKQIGRVPNSIKKSVKLITVAGAKSNILVTSAELKKI